MSVHVGYNAGVCSFNPDIYPNHRFARRIDNRAGNCFADGLLRFVDSDMPVVDRIRKVRMFQSLCKNLMDSTIPDTHLRSDMIYIAI
jgi:hypothetical protein